MVEVQKTLNDFGLYQTHPKCNFSFYLVIKTNTFEKQLTLAPWLIENSIFSLTEYCMMNEIMFVVV